MDNETDIKHRLTELCERAERTGTYVYTDFLSMAQLSMFRKMQRAGELKNAVVYGGGVGSADKTAVFGPEDGPKGVDEHPCVIETERCMVRFWDEELCGYSEDFPISIVKIAPVQAKFADALTHRDFLGAVLGLGIEREKTGDIFIFDNTAYMFVNSAIAEFITDNLEYVKHTHVKTEVVTELPEAMQPRFEKRTVIVSSNRIDAMISKLYNLSREQSLKLVTEARVFINGEEITSNSKALKEGDVVSVRGFGKWIFRGESGKTRKDRLCVEIEVYV